MRDLAWLRCARANPKDVKISSITRVKMQTVPMLSESMMKMMPRSFMSRSLKETWPKLATTG